MRTTVERRSPQNPENNQVVLPSRRWLPARGKATRARLCRYVGGFAAALIILAPSIARAAGGKSAVPETWWVAIWLAGGAALGVVGKMVAEIITGRVAARRAFVDKTTGQISDLAKQHYWALANHAGVLAGMLEEYLQLVDYHLLLEYSDQKGLRERLDLIARKYADDTFYDLCRLVWLFNRFQFDGSNTYLLTSDVAGRACKQLYNTFIAALPVKEESAHLNTLAILHAMSCPRKVKGREKPIIGAELTVIEFNRLFRGQLSKSREVYQDWLNSRLDSVTLAAKALRAYNELLSHELAKLYRGWFKHEPYSALPFADAVAYNKWPETLSVDSVRVIAHALSGSELLQSLATGGTRERHDGRARQVPKDSAVPPSTKDDQADVGDNEETKVPPRRKGGAKVPMPRRMIRQLFPPGSKGDE
jgi:hypothetical protein